MFQCYDDVDKLMDKRKKLRFQSADDTIAGSCPPRNGLGVKDHSLNPDMVCAWLYLYIYIINSDLEGITVDETQKGTSSKTRQQPTFISPHFIWYVTKQGKKANV